MESMDDRRKPGRFSIQDFPAKRGPRDLHKTGVAGTRLDLCILMRKSKAKYLSVCVRINHDKRGSDPNR